MDMATFVGLYTKVRNFEEELYKKFTYEQNSNETYELRNYEVELVGGNVNVNVGSAEEIKEKYSNELKIVIILLNLGCT